MKMLASVPLTCEVAKVEDFPKLGSAPPMCEAAKARDSESLSAETLKRLLVTKITLKINPQL